MLPILFTIGSFSLRTSTVLVLLAFFLAGFVLWRKAREEHYPEDQVFDMFLLSTLFGVLGARLGYIFFHFGQFNSSPAQWFDIFSNAGFNGLIGIILAGYYCYRFAQSKKWDGFEMLDFWTISLSLGLSVLYFGQFLDGSGVGYPTSLPVGVQFAGIFEPVHPVQLYQSLFFLVLYVYLSRVELQYRNFQWYRSGKKSAQTGFLVAMALVTGGLFYFFLTFFKPPMIEILSTNVDQLLSLFIFAVGALVLFHRSGRPLPFTREKKKRKKLVDRLKTANPEKH